MYGARRSLPLLVVFWGCVGPGQLLRNCSGSPDYSYDTGWWDSGTWDSASPSGDSAEPFTAGDCNIVLDEAGDVAGDPIDESADVGTIYESEMPFYVCGYTSYPGNDGSSYTGDRDLFSLVAGYTGMMYFTVQPLSAYTDVDAMVCDGSYNNCEGSSSTSGEGYSETLSRSVTSGERVNVVVYGRSGDSANYYVKIFR